MDGITGTTTIIGFSSFGLGKTNLVRSLEDQVRRTSAETARSARKERRRTNNFYIKKNISLILHIKQTLNNSIIRGIGAFLSWYLIKCIKSINCLGNGFYPL